MAKWQSRGSLANLLYYENARRERFKKVRRHAVKKHAEPGAGPVKPQHAPTHVHGNVGVEFGRSQRASAGQLEVACQRRGVGNCIRIVTPRGKHCVRASQHAVITNIGTQEQ